MNRKETEVEGSGGEYSVDEDDQLQAEDTLIDRGVDDVLDEGYSPVERPLMLDRFGTTASEQEEGESLDQRLAEEEPDVDVTGGDGVDWDENEMSDEEVGDARSGRLLATDSGVDGEGTALIARDVGIDGGAASAEEAAMHEIGEAY